MKFTIEHNNVITNDPCGICGERTDPGGLDVFVRERDGSNPELVCVPCIEKLAPELLALQRLALAAEEFGAHERMSDLEAMVNAAREYFATTRQGREVLARRVYKEEQLTAWRELCDAQDNGEVIYMANKTN